MNIEIDSTMARKKSIKTLIKDLQAEDLREIIVELSKLSKPNRQFIELYLLGSDNANPEPIAEEAKKKIYNYLYGRSLPKLDLRGARKVVSDYGKVLKEYPRWATELKLYYVEVGTQITDEFGDMYEGFYDSMGSMFGSFCKEVQTHPSSYDYFADRIKQLQTLTDHMGWGYGDDINYYVEELEEALGIA